MKQMMRELFEYSKSDNIACREKDIELHLIPNLMDVTTSFYIPTRLHVEKKKLFIGVYAVGMEPSRGMSMDSFRAECSGCLSLLWFFIRLAEYTGRCEPWRGIIGTDSQSMLNTVALKPRDDHDHVQHVLLKPLELNVPEWDKPDRVAQIAINQELENIHLPSPLK
jgi:hypothetical protein